MTGRNPVGHYDPTGLAILRATAEAAAALRAVLADRDGYKQTITRWADACAVLDHVTCRPGGVRGISDVLFEHRAAPATPAARCAVREALTPLLAGHDTRWRTIVLVCPADVDGYAVPFIHEQAGITAPAVAAGALSSTVLREQLARMRQGGPPPEPASRFLLVDG